GAAVVVVPEVAGALDAVLAAPEEPAAAPPEEPPPEQAATASPSATASTGMRHQRSVRDTIGTSGAEQSAALPRDTISRDFQMARHHRRHMAMRKCHAAKGWRS
ncbi:MAG TPA: hypothetical protein VFA45_14700, partial [Actinomycetes bacterium]|nr:hypothetical protein [Actinomycetes bacterium]